MASVAAAASDNSEEDAAASRSRVQDWTASLRPGLPLDHGERHDPIARLYLVTTELYCGILPALGRHLGKSDALYRSIERGYSSLVLWSRDHDVASGNLDAALEHSQGSRHLALRLLTNVCGAVLDRLIPRTGLEISPQIRTSQKKARTAVEVALAILPSDTDVEESGEDADSAPFTSDSLVRVASDIHTIVGALAGLGPLFEEPIPDRTEHEQPAQLNIATPVAPLVRLIHLIFPACEDDTARGVAHAALETSRRILEEASAPAPGDQSEQVTTTSRPPQKALTLVGTIFHDSALGTSLGTGSLYAETVLPYEGGSDRPVNIQLPQMPKEGVDGTPFLCQTCNQTVLPRSEAEWKRHLMSDARPYMCIESSCPEKFLPFSDKSTWTAHIASHYANRPGLQVHCPICGISYNAAAGDIGTIATHLAHHLEPIAAEFIIDGVTFTRIDESVDGAASNAPGASSGKGVEGSPRGSRGLVD
ncbi:hypothetical protein RB595_001820 [Gaeumannomyces hyphopodioides]